MSKYDKKTSGVTSVLIRNAHGMKKINHSEWNNELGGNSPIESNTVKSYAPIKAMYICFIIGWLILLIPIPIVTYILAFPLIVSSFVMAIICLSKNATKHGVIGLFFSFVVSPAIYLIGTLLSIGMISMALNDMLDKNSKDRNMNSKPVISQPYKYAPPSPKSNTVSTKPVNYQPYKQVLPSKKSTSTVSISTNKPKPQTKYKYILTLDSGSIVVTDELKAVGESIMYTDRNISVTIPRSQLKSYKKIALK